MLAISLYNFSPKLTHSSHKVQAPFIAPAKFILLPRLFLLSPAALKLPVIPPSLLLHLRFPLRLDRILGSHVHCRHLSFFLRYDLHLLLTLLPSLSHRSRRKSSNSCFQLFPYILFLASLSFPPKFSHILYDMRNVTIVLVYLALRPVLILSYIFITFFESGPSLASP